MTVRAIFVRTVIALTAGVAGLLLLTGTASAWTITTMAGTGIWGKLGDGGPAVDAQLFNPSNISPGPDGALLVADHGRIRRIDAEGMIATVAGNGIPGFSGDGGQAVLASLASPSDVAFAPDGGFYIADAGRIRRVLPDGTILTIAGTGAAGYSGDGGPAINAQLGPSSIAVAADGSLLVVDNGNSRVRQISRDGIVTTVAGNGIPGFGGDGGPATAASLSPVSEIAATADGGFLLSEAERIRKVSASGVISTIAGTGTAGFSGDGVPAISAQINDPAGIAELPDRSFVVADRGNHRIRHVTASGAISTIAGSGIPGSSGDGGPADRAQLYRPSDVKLLQDGSMAIVDTSGQRIRRISPSVAAPAPEPAPAPAPAPEPAPEPAVPPTSTARISAPMLRIARVDRGKQFLLGTSLPVGSGRAAKLQIRVKGGRWITRATARTGPRGQVRARLRIRAADFGTARSIPVRITAAGRAFRAAPIRRAQIPAIRQRLTIRATITGATGRTAQIQLRNGARWATIARIPIPDNGRLTRRHTLTTKQARAKKLAVRISLAATDTTHRLTGPTRNIRVRTR